MPSEQDPPRSTGSRLLLAGTLAIALGVATLAWAVWPRGVTRPAVHPARSVMAVDQSGVDPAAYASQLRAAADDARAANGLPRFRRADCAVPLALSHANALVGRPLEHAPLGPVRTACPGADVVAENLSRAAAQPADVVTAWMASPGHRSNLLDPTLTAMVVGCTHDGTQMLCSQLFTGSSASPSP